MSEIIDTLIATKVNTPNFTVNLAAANKRVIVNDGAAPCFMMNSSLKYYFQPGDNLLLLNAGFYIPESFITTEKLVPTDPVFPFVHFTVYDAAGVNKGILPGLGDLGGIILPFENYEGAYNIYSDINSLYNAGKFKLSVIMFFNSTWISMINVPADLDGKTFYIYPFIKVLHSLPMIP
jgi:hypothetical protein